MNLKPGVTPNSTGHIRFVSRSLERVFAAPVEVIAAPTLGEVLPCLERVAAGVARGCYAAGFLTYEAAPAFDPAVRTHAPGPLPLLWFGLYAAMDERAPAMDRDEGAFAFGPWTPLVSEDEYIRRVRRIRELIAAGDTYQVNYTFPLEASFRGDSRACFNTLCAAQRADYCACVNLGRHHLLSASPELFFRLEGERLETRPMKGTRPRGRWAEEDRELARALAASGKDRAENVMIVDLLRNDMARISEPDSVRVRALYEVEAYPTVWQMISTIRSRTRATVPAIMRALFPSGSVTGAPKIRTMEIIRDLESGPRGIYCGTIGWWAPDGRAEFNVAIRTAVVDTQAGRARYHVGSGITYGSSAADEYRECLDKAAVLARRDADFDLIETLCHDGGYFLLPEHLDRLAGSAAYFGFACDRPAIEKALLAAVAADNAVGKTICHPAHLKSPTPIPSGGGELYQAPLLEGGAGGSLSIPLPGGARGGLSSILSAPLKVRLLLRNDGSFAIHKDSLPPPAELKVGFAARPVDAGNIFLYHKTTCRDAYRQALASRPDCDDVLLWNTRGEITESTIANVVLEIDGRKWTPPLSAGLLGGVFRRRLLARGELAERVLTKADVGRARAIFLINSVRRWIPVRWMG